MPVHDSNKVRQHKCIGFSEALELQREKRAARVGAQPWLGRKLCVGIVVCIACYTYYVYVARFCVPMVRRESKAIGGLSTGIAFLVIFNLLFLMFGWAYTKVVFTSPGYAIDYVSKTPPPLPGPQSRGSLDSNESIGGTPYNAVTPASRSQSRPSVDIPSFSNGQASPRAPRSPRPSRSPPHSRRNTHDTAPSMSQVRSVPPRRTDSVDAGPLDSIPPVASSRVAANSSQHPNPPPPAHVPRSSNGSSSGLPPLLYSRRPPTHPALLPEYRYCGVDEVIKPMRTHHCRSCGTCILKYDHHCPWIGQCVGAFNHKFFVNFLQWCAIFTIFIFASLVALVARAASSSTSPALDPQHIVIIAFSGIFAIFTTVLFFTQVNLIVINTSTVEHLGMERMKEREQHVLSQMTKLPCPCTSVDSDLPMSQLPGGVSPFRVLISRRRIVKQWDAEWGKIETEGNLWWLGSQRANWEATMGRGKLGWILPIGRSLGNGLSYPTNPRFDRDGRWRRRSEWPDGLRQR